MKFGIIDFMMASLQIAFIVLKLCGVISWSWWIVLLPIIFIVVLNILVFLFIVCVRTYQSHQFFKKYGTDDPLAIRKKKIQQRNEEFVRSLEKVGKRTSQLLNQ